MKIQAATTAQQYELESVVFDAPLLLIDTYPCVKQEQAQFSSYLLSRALKTADNLNLTPLNFPNSVENFLICRYVILDN